MESKSNNNQVQKRPDRHGANNTMFQRHHNLATRLKQSLAHRQYQERVRQALKVNQQASPLSMGEFLQSPELKECLTKIIKEELQKLQL